MGIGDLLRNIVGGRQKRGDEEWDNRDRTLYSYRNEDEEDEDREYRYRDEDEEDEDYGYRYRRNDEEEDEDRD
ncbi:hypothetical protein VF14_31285 [Nostoc linckia z18]|jgi:hypothetical protein|uniref:Uncharacterized protein n=3 Tax=Nostoc TaxID=1177 RepID=A0A9Q6EJ89_NOSLI|nr:MULTISPECIES: polyribonucleotide nucleotidyltransferase [Nostoc]MBL1198014.1 polyribonucleotide nucleotidyltransferase [Nostoc sp. GBBB01]MDZ8012380.1 polyribonucleotide nucleotidyltransferase [Nostoc sp. ZfuVER08]PHK31956.1 hypothetical protein VF12_27350 [Nostoc linckia z15]PHK42019.1 hypothetical protein VF13_30400 [Nostoc linckia z16]MBC1238361.1 polyribonucleotide nucleotidyltransferase [Nostoc sp. 2RC]